MESERRNIEDALPKVLGVIPARGGSKRLPRKNIKKLMGKPLLVYTIEAAQKSKCLTDYLVSSEDDEILKVAKDFGAPVPFVRPAELSGDNVRNIETVFHALHFMESERGFHYDIIVLLQPTCPVRSFEHIDEAVNKLWNSELETAVSVKGPYKKRDPILKRIKNGCIEDYCPVDNEKDAEPFYLYNASIYAVKRDYFIKNRKLISKKQVPVIMDQLHSIDIDTEIDFITAEAYLRYKKECKREKGDNHK